MLESAKEVKQPMPLGLKALVFMSFFLAVWSLLSIVDGSSDMKILNIVMSILWAIFFLFSGIGILQKRRYGRWLLLFYSFFSVSFLLFGLFIMPFLIFGSFTSNVFVASQAWKRPDFLTGILYLALGVLAIFYLGHRKIREFFALSEKNISTEKKAAVIFALIPPVLVLLSYGAFHVFVYKNRSIPEPQTIRYELADVEGYEKRQIMNFEIQMPPEYELMFITYENEVQVFDMYKGTEYYKNEYSGHTYFFRNEKADEYIVATSSSVAEATMGVLAMKDSYEHFEKLVYEKAGIVPLVLKTMAMKKSDYIYSEEWKGFKSSLGENKGKGSETYYLWNIEPATDITLIFSAKNGRINKEEAKKVVSSVRHNSEKEKPEVSFQKGMALMGEERYKDAKLLFANALYHDWKNPEYHYQMAQAFLELEDDKGALTFLQNVVQFDPDHKNAEEILDEVIKGFKKEKGKK